MPPRPTSLRALLLRWLLAPLLAVLLLNAWIGHHQATATADEAQDRLLLASADDIAEGLAWRDGELRVNLPYAAIQLLETSVPERIYYRVIGPDGRTATGFDDLPGPPRRPPLGEEAVSWTAEYRGETIHLLALHRFVYGSPSERPAVVVVAESGEARALIAQRILRADLLREAALIAAAAALLALGLHRGLRPLRRLSEQLLARGPDDLGPLGTDGVPAELRPLIAALNQHTGRVVRLQASRQQLITDASHQMRTPLAEMRMQIDYRLRQRDADVGPLRETLQAVRGDIDRLSRLVAQMLTLARSDPEATADPRRDVVDLADLAHGATLDFVSLARTRGIDLAYEGPGARDGRACVAGHGPLLRELLANLVDNAIVHGRAGGSVTVRVSGGREPMLEVEDDGPGIPDADRERVFERFVRLREGQTAAAPGSGLGLAIVRNIAHAHRARVALLDGSGGHGLRVQVRFAATAGSPTVNAPSSAPA